MDPSKIITYQLFQEMLKHRNEFYTYDAFIEAAKRFNGFGTTGNLQTRKRELAAFFGQTSHVTTGGWDGAPGGRYTWGYHYIDEIDNPTPYHGRGPIQLSHKYNYEQAGKSLGLDLKNHPDLISIDPVIAFKTAIWFWMTPQWNKPSCHNVIVEKWHPSDDDIRGGRIPGYGVITNIINGGFEAGNGWNPQVEDRIGYYKRYCDMLGLQYGDNLDCYHQRPFA